MGDFFNWIYALIKDLTRFVSDAYDYLAIKLQVMFMAIGEYFVTMTGDIVYAIIVDTGLFASVSSLWNTIPSNSRYILTALELHTALGIILAAYIVRFTIRRIPVIG